MSSVHVAFSSDGLIPLSAMAEGARGVVVAVRGHNAGRTDRLLSLGVTPGANITVLQTFPGVVFLCDQTELAVERAIADAVLVKPLEGAS
jgi:Fe2+ transport system protein FeoA